MKELEVFHIFFLSLCIHFSNLHTERGARTHDPKIKSHVLFLLNEPDPPEVFCIFIVVMVKQIYTCDKIAEN